MNEQMQRLYEAARSLKGVAGQSALARLLAATPQVLHNWEQRGISKHGLLRAQKMIGCSASWLETGVGRMEFNSEKNVVIAPVGARRIPLISYVQAGHWTDVTDSYQPGAGDEYLLTDMDVSASTFALEIKGDSMLPEFREGDRVIIDPNVVPQPGDFVVAKNGEGEATFKKYRPRGINERGDVIFELVPLNDDYPSLRSDVNHVLVVGTMVEHRKYRRR